MAPKAVKEGRERRDHQLSDELSHACVGLHLLRQSRLASTPNQRVLAELNRKIRILGWANLAYSLAIHYTYPPTHYFLHPDIKLGVPGAAVGKGTVADGRK